MTATSFAGMNAMSKATAAAAHETGALAHVEQAETAAVGAVGAVQASAVVFDFEGHAGSFPLEAN